jgi:hypothetical protein
MKKAFIRIVIILCLLKSFDLFSQPTSYEIAKFKLKLSNDLDWERLINYENLAFEAATKMRKYGGQIIKADTSHIEIYIQAFYPYLRNEPEDTLIHKELFLSVNFLNEFTFCFLISNLPEKEFLQYYFLGEFPSESNYYEINITNDCCEHSTLTSLNRTTELIHIGKYRKKSNKKCDLN